MLVKTVGQFDTPQLYSSAYKEVVSFQFKRSELSTEAIDDHSMMIILNELVWRFNGKYTKCFDYYYCEFEFACDAQDFENHVNAMFDAWNALEEKMLSGEDE